MVTVAAGVAETVMARPRAAGVPARQVGLTLVGRTRGKRFMALSGQERLVYDQNLDYVEEESARHKRKGEARDD